MDKKERDKKKRIARVAVNLGVLFGVGGFTYAIIAACWGSSIDQVLLVLAITVICDIISLYIWWKNITALSKEAQTQKQAEEEEKKRQKEAIDYLKKVRKETEEKERLKNELKERFAHLPPEERRKTIQKELQKEAERKEREAQRREAEKKAEQERRAAEQAKAEAERKERDKKKKLLIILAVAGAVVIVLLCALGGGSSSTKGNGVTTCKNCGSSPVYALGFCKKCYKSFHDYTYGDKDKYSQDFSCDEVEDITDMAHVDSLPSVTIDTVCSEDVGCFKFKNLNNEIIKTHVKLCRSGNNNDAIKLHIVIIPKAKPLNAPKKAQIIKLCSNNLKTDKQHRNFCYVTDKKDAA